MRSSADPFPSKTGENYDLKKKKIIWSLWKWTQGYTEIKEILTQKNLLKFSKNNKSLWYLNRASLPHHNSANENFTLKTKTKDSLFPSSQSGGYLLRGNRMSAFLVVSPTTCYWGKVPDKSGQEMEPPFFHPNTIYGMEALPSVWHCWEYWDPDCSWPSLSRIS